MTYKNTEWEGYASRKLSFYLIEEIKFYLTKKINLKKVAKNIGLLFKYKAFIYLPKIIFRSKSSKAKNK